MDTSQTYIKMRRKAIPDLGMGTKPEADIMVNAGRDLSLEHPLILRVETYKRISDDVWSDLKGDYYCDGDAGACQLERQDQLQGMASSRPTPHSLAYTFGFFCEPIRCYRLHGTWVDNEDGGGIAQERELTNQPELEYPERFTSMEQLWLAFVMEKRYSKHWNGDDWIKVS